MWFILRESYPLTPYLQVSPFTKTISTASSSELQVRQNGPAVQINTYFPQDQKVKWGLYKLYLWPRNTWVNGSCCPFHFPSTESILFHPPLFSIRLHWPPCDSGKTTKCSSLQTLHLPFFFCLECSFPGWSSWLIPSSPPGLHSISPPGWDLS